MRSLALFLFILLVGAPALRAEDLGNLSANPFNFDSTANQFGKGSPFAPDGINNPHSPYGSPFSNQSATNPFATDAPRLYGTTMASSAPIRSIPTRPATNSAATARPSRRTR